MSWFLWCLMYTGYAVAEPTMAHLYVLDHCVQCPDCCVYDEQYARLNDLGEQEDEDAAEETENP